MHPYLVVPLLAAVAGSAFGALILMGGIEQAPNRRAGLIALGASWWAACEVLWNTAADPLTAVWLHRLAAPGFVFVGPLAVHLVVDAAETRPQRLARLLPWLYAVSVICLGMAWTGPGLIREMVEVRWGYGGVPGPVFGPWAAFTAACLVVAIAGWMRSYRSSPIAMSRRNGPVVAISLSVACLLGLASDALLPLLGIQSPRLGSLSMAFAGGVTAWALRRYGYSRLASQAFSNRILRTLPDGVALVALHGRIRVANRRLDSLLGCPPGGAVGRSIGAHLDVGLIDPPREERQVECELTPTHGQPLPVSVCTAPLHDPDGSITGVVLIVRDLGEVATLRNRLITSGRLAAVGELAAGIAHELNNPLAFVRANLGLLRQEWDQLQEALRKEQPRGWVPEATDDWDDLIDESLEGVERAVTIVRDIREFSHAGSESRDLADPNELLEQVLRVARPQLPPGASVETRFSDVGRISCEPQRLKQLFLNLVVNAAQAVGDAGRVCVVTADQGAHVLVRIEDDGCGIPEELVDRIFDPFFTTKRVGRGTGLGLSISHEIVRSHGGQIWCEAIASGGTAFLVRLPRSGPRQPSPPAAA